MEPEVARRMEELGIPEQTPVAVAGAWALVHGLCSLLNDDRVNAVEVRLRDNSALTEQVCRLLNFS